MDYHPLAGIFPLMADAELSELAADIKAHGQQEPIAVLDGTILDGRNRFIACGLAKVEPQFEEWAPKNGDTALDFVLSKNLKRRHLNDSQRAMVATRISALSQGENRANVAIATFTQGEAAKAMSVGRDSVIRARKVVESAAPEVVAAVDAGEVAVSDAAAIADAPKAVQKAAVKRVKEGKAKTLKQAVLCSRCRRVGAIKDCESCALMRKVKAGKSDLEKKADAAALAEDPEPDQTIEEQIRAKNGELEGWCRDLLAFGKSMPDDPWLQDCNRRKGALDKLDGVAAMVRSAKCHARCPKCNGDGCRQCHKTGRMTKYALDQL